MSSVSVQSPRAEFASSSFRHCHFAELRHGQFGNLRLLDWPPLAAEACRKSKAANGHIASTKTFTLIINFPGSKSGLQAATAAPAEGKVL